MKANRKFLHGDEEAVSPVIAVILMVAITVVLAATVYVWVSGFGSNSSQPAKSIAFTSGGTLNTDETLGGTAGATDSYKAYIVSAASPGLKYSDLTFTLNGVTLSRGTAASCDATPTDFMGASDTSGWLACNAALSASATARASDALVTAGDHLYVFLDASSMSGQTFRVLDSNANSIITTLVVS